MNRSVSDLGISAYLMMKGFKVVGKRDRDIIFCIDQNNAKRFDRVFLDYLSSEFHRFDSYIMSLKKIPEIFFDEVNIRFVTDLGAAAYIMMHQYKIVGKRGRAFYFEIDEETSEKFDELSIEYLSSEFHKFDSCLMSLKKINEYVSDKN
jgi:hypothetical protein